MVEIGIDLGTSNSLIGYFNKNDNQAELIPNEFGDFLTPSVVAITEDNSIIIGKRAREQQSVQPETTVSMFKKEMGTKVTYNLGNQLFTPEELSACVLTALKTDAEKYLEVEILDAVISVPAYFNAFQREATVSAAKLAGFETIELISEPTAASLTYGINNANQDQNFMVMDLGGGTFDVSLITLFENIIQVEAISGDVNLGGNDFTQAIVDDMIKTFKLDREQLSIKNCQIIYQQAERIKKRFSERLTLAAEVSCEIDGEKYSYSLSSKTLIELILPLLAKFRGPINRVMNDANLSPFEIDKFILVGGATRLIAVQQGFEKITGQKVETVINQDESVAIGATIRAHMLNSHTNDELFMTDVIGFSLGIGTHNKEEIGNDLFLPIIERNTTIPISVEKTVCKVSNRSTSVMVSVYQGENIYVKDNILLGELEYPCKRLKTDDPIKIRYSYDISGLLEVEVSDVKQNKHKSLIIQNNHKTLTEKEIEQIKLKLSKFKINAKDSNENMLLLKRFDRLYKEMIGEKRSFIAERREQFLKGVNDINPRIRHQSVLQAKEILEQFEDMI